MKLNRKNFRPTRGQPLPPPPPDLARMRRAGAKLTLRKARKVRA